MIQVWKACVLILLPALLAPLADAAPNPMDCRDWFDRAGKVLQQAGIHDDGGTAIPYFPWLRTDRWLASLREEALKGDGGSLWLDAMSNLGRRAWTAELKRLPESAPLFPDGRAARIRYMNACQDALLDTTSPVGIPNIKVPDSYATWLRVVGVYSVTKVLATPSIHRYRRDMEQRFVSAPVTPAITFRPPDYAGNMPTPEALAHNSLEMPLPSEGAADALFAHYAPVVSMLSDTPANRPGAVSVSGTGPAVDTSRPEAYHWLSWTSFEGKKLLQLNYEFWFSRRPRQGLIDPYAGTLDALIWRVTLKPDGSVLLYDSIHGCGCYHKIYLVQRDMILRADIQGDIPVIDPDRVPDANQGRVQLVLQADTHYVVGVFAAPQRKPSDRPYGLEDADQLRALPDGEGGYRSLFNKKGIVSASKRAERFYLWPLGIPAAGAMRQPGHHAIAFIGRRQFDDPDLFDQLVTWRETAQ